MEAEHEIRIEEIMGAMTCPKGFKCCKSGFEELCKATDIAIEGFVKCLEENPEECWFSASSGRSYCCQCPLNICSQESKQINFSVESFAFSLHFSECGPATQMSPKTGVISGMAALG